MLMTFAVIVGGAANNRLLPYEAAISVANPTAATTVVSDDVDTTTVSLTATASAAEGGTITYTASVGAPVTGSPVSNASNVLITSARASISLAIARSDKPERSMNRAVFS